MARFPFFSSEKESGRGFRRALCPFFSNAPSFSSFAWPTCWKERRNPPFPLSRWTGVVARFFLLHLPVRAVAEEFLFVPFFFFFFPFSPLQLLDRTSVQVIFFRRFHLPVGLLGTPSPPPLAGANHAALPPFRHSFFCISVLCAMNNVCRSLLSSFPPLRESTDLAKPFFALSSFPRPRSSSPLFFPLAELVRGQDQWP